MKDQTNVWARTRVQNISIGTAPPLRTYTTQEKLYMVPDGSDMRKLDYELLLKIPHAHWPEPQQVAREYLLAWFRYWDDGKMRADAFHGCPREPLSQRGSDERLMERRSA